jgi:hypothetical protein
LSNYSLYKRPSREFDYTQQRKFYSEFDNQINGIIEIYDAIGKKVLQKELTLIKEK